MAKHKVITAREWERLDTFWREDYDTVWTTTYMLHSPSEDNMDAYWREDKAVECLCRMLFLLTRFG